jgi:translocation and assembly module TamA
VSVGHFVLTACLVLNPRRLLTVVWPPTKGTLRRGRSVPRGSDSDASRMARGSPLAVWVPVFLVLALLVSCRAAVAAAVEVRIDGIEGRLLENVRLSLSIAQLDIQDRDVVPDLAAVDEDEVPPDVTLAELRRRHRVAPAQIREALMPFGHYLAEVSGELIESERGHVARYQVDPGPAAVIRQLDVRVLGEAEDAAPVRQTLRQLRLAEGQQLDHRRYEEAKRQLFDTVFDRGFLDAAWRTSEMRVLEDRLQADVTLVLDSGPQYRFGEVSFDHEVLDARFLAKFVDIEPGESYNVQRLLSLQRVIREADYFSRVEVRADPDRADEQYQVPITVVTEAAPSQRYTMGVGYGSDTGPRVTLGVLLRRVNDRGHRLATDLRVSEIENSIGVRYDVPIRNVAADRLSFTATARQEEIADADISQFAIGASQVVGWRGFQRHLYVQAQRELFEFNGTPQEGVNLLIPGITLSRERANDLRYPTRGYRIWADWRAGVDQLLSDVSFSRLELSANWVRRIGGGTRLLVRGEAGWLWTEQFDLLPPSQRFFAGGDRSVRGYGYRKIGPTDEFDVVLGGERLLAGSIEIERIFFRDYGAAVFVDAGDAFNDTPDFRVGAGVGLRWRSPIGVVRADVAHPFDDPESNFRFHLTIGTDL